MSEPIGTHVNLREVFSPERWKQFKKGQLLFFENGDDKTCIRIIRAGNKPWSRFEGVIIEPPKTIEEAREEQQRLLELDLASQGYQIAPEDVTDKIEVVKPKKPAKKKESDGV